MHCAACQHENPSQAKFCLECGAAMPRLCTGCGAQVPPKAKFCMECGRSTNAPSPSVAPAQPVQYAPAHLTQRILANKSSLEGERKHVTVMFADIKGSMELLAERDPEDARRILDPVLDLMMQAVHRYEGTVNQVMGDGIMALFGAPLSQEDHAVRACYAALRMHDVIARHGDELQRTQGITVQLRVGLNSGEVVVRAIGNDLRMDYSAIGQTTHLAARMEQMAKAGTTLLTPDTLKLSEGYVQVKALGALAVKGLAAPLEVFELTAASTARTRLQAMASRGFTRFVGRDHELDVLTQAIAHAAQGKGQAVAIVGEPGVGKSRLLYEFTHSHRTQGWMIVEAGSVSYGKATPYAPVIELLKGYFRIGARDESREIREKVTGRLLTLDRALETVLSPLLSLLDQPTLDASWDKLEPTQRRRLTHDALKRLWLREAQAQPLLLVFEDLHWIDSETQEFLNGLMESVPAARLLLLFNYRPEYQHPWGSKTYYTQVRLDALSQASAQDLLSVLLGNAPSLQPLHRLLIERTEGNPFYLEESVKTLLEAGTLAGEMGQRQLLKPIESVDVPATVQARIDRLAEVLARGEQLALAIGDPRRKSWIYAYLSQLLTEQIRPRDAIDPARKALEAAQAVGDEILQLNAYGYLQAAHFTLGDFPAAAAVNQHADKIGEQAVVKGLSQGIYTVLLIVSAPSEAERGSFDNAIARGRFMLRHADTSGHPFAINLGCIALGYSLTRQGRAPEAVHPLERALLMCRTYDMEVQIPWSASTLGFAYACAGRHSEGIELLTEGVNTSDRIAIRRYQPMRRSFLANAFLVAGRFDEAIAQAQLSLDLARRYGERGPEAWSHYLIGESLLELQRQDDPATLEHYDLANSLARELGMRPLIAHCHLGYGKLHSRIGQIDQARKQLADAVSLYESMEMRYWPDLARAALRALD